MIKKILFFFINFLFCSPLLGVDYFISVYDSISNRNLLDVGQKMLQCQSIFEKSSKSSRVRIQRTASFSVDDGRRNDQVRGMQLNEQEIDKFEELSNTVVARVLMEWKKSGFYSDFEVARAFDLHRRLSPHRLKIISTESVGANGFPQLDAFNDGTGNRNFSLTEGELFSAIRIYDSSPVMKSFGRRREIPTLSPRDTQEIAEQVFTDFSLDKALSALNIPRSNNTWSLGLGSIAGKQDSALKTLFAQVADLLDLHYNNRDFYNLGRLHSILDEDVDIVFYSGEKLTPYYQNVLDLYPMQREDGYPFYTTKNGKRYYIFHIKGSDFIKKYFHLRFHQPLYGNTNGLRNEEKIRNFYLKGLSQAYDKISPTQYDIKNLDEFFLAIEELMVEYVSLSQISQLDEENFFKLLAHFIKLRASLHDDIFDQTYAPYTVRRVQTILQELLGSDAPTEAGLMYFGFLEYLIRDPVQFLANRSNFHNETKSPQ